jgi:hypothetical protein
MAVVLWVRAWLSNPAHAGAGIAGFALVVWSVLPLAERPIARGFEFVEDVGRAWGRDRSRAIAGIVGVALLLWSIWPAMAIIARER